jgi:hypothetical protein
MILEITYPHAILHEGLPKKGFISFLLGNIALSDRIRYRIWIPYPDPNLQTQLNPDLIRIRNLNTITNGNFVPITAGMTFSAKNCYIISYFCDEVLFLLRLL